MNNKALIKNPNAIVVIWNYQDRTGGSTLSPNKDDVYNIEPAIINTSSLKSISTQKSKSNPAGAFEFRLAPTENWVSSISAGSWCVILMTNEKMTNTPISGSKSVDEKSFKMLGRIESVRGVSAVNQNTGALQTEYIVTGSDWGAIFNTGVYIDPGLKGKEESDIGFYNKIFFDEWLRLSHYSSVSAGKSANTDNSPNKGKTDTSGTKYNRDTIKKDSGSSGLSAALVAEESDMISSEFVNLIADTTTIDHNDIEVKRRISSPTQLVKYIMGLWGVNGLAENFVDEYQYSFGVKYKMPKDLCKYMNFSEDGANTVVADLISYQDGILTGYDKYEDKDETVVVLNPNSILGEHSMWQLLSTCMNNAVNELIPEIRFSNGKPKLTLYNRVMPFAINSIDHMLKDSMMVGDNKHKKEYSSFVKNFYSQYKNVRTIEVDKEDVLMCSYGTNWRDRVNFIEINMANVSVPIFNLPFKIRSRFSDNNSIARDGILPLRRTCNSLPMNEKDDSINAELAFTYKYLLKEFFFDTHKMLNGTLSLIGQDKYIQVGDNIKIDSVILNKKPNINSEQKTINKTFLLAHVESITHDISIDANGSKVFATVINFTRGIIVDKANNIVYSDFNSGFIGAIDQDTKKLSKQDKDSINTITRSTDIDPDFKNRRI